jgi:leader peptidase (prepilin peptidase) / N-methyltransferase
MRPILVAALAAAGLLIGWGLRIPVARLSGGHAGPPPLVLEIITAALLGGLAARVHPALVLAAACWLAACGVALGWIDASVQRLSDVLTLAAYAGTAALLVAAAAAAGTWHSLLRAAGGGAGLAIVAAVVAVLSKSALGLGDAKLAASLGTLLAWYGWLTLARGVIAAFLLGGLYGAGLIVVRRARRRQRIAFGPFMLAGAFLAVLAAGVGGG